MQRMLLWATLLGFGALTGVAIAQDGLLGIFKSITGSYGSLQIFVDLVIALVLIMVWMWHDAQKNGRRIWPWLLLTLAAGAFGPLLYLLTQKKSNA